MVDQDLPHQSFNLIALIISFLAFIWGWGAFRRFHSVLNYRYAVLTENTVMLRGLGGCLSQFSGTMPSHTRSILHTRNATAATDVKFMYVPFHVVHPIQPPAESTTPPKHNSSRAKKSDMESKAGTSDRLSIPIIGTAKENGNNSNKKVSFAADNAGPYAYGFLNQTFYPHPVNAREIIPKSQTKLCGFVPIWCATDCTILVLYGLKMDHVKRFFKYSIKANKLFMKGSKYRDRTSGVVSLPKISKGKKYDTLERGGTDRHIYAERLTSLFTKKDLCTAFSSIEPSTRTANCSDSHDDRMYHVPIYDAVTLPQPRDGDHSLLSPNEVTLDTGLLQEEVNLSMGEGEDLHGCPKTEAASERGGGAISRYPDGTTIKSPGRFSRHSKTADTEDNIAKKKSGGGRDNAKKGLHTPAVGKREAIGILIIPRDLPYTGTPEDISTVQSTSASGSPEVTPTITSREYDTGKNHTTCLEGDIELGTTSGSGKFFSSRQNKPTVSGDTSIDRSRYTSLDFGLQVLQPNPVPACGANSDAQRVSAYDIEELYVHAAGSMFASSDIYGLTAGDKETAERTEGKPEEGAEEDSNECVICLTEAQEIFLLPCRHLCVCKECFPHIDKCPVCRSEFNDYVTVRRDRSISIKAPKCVQRTTRHNEDEDEKSGTGGARKQGISVGEANKAEDSKCGKIKSL